MTDAPQDAPRRQAKFWRKFQLLTRGRLDVLRALELIVEEESDPAFREVLRDLRTGIRDGESLSDALDRHPAVFSRSVRELVRSAERSGAWDDILPLIADGLLNGTLE